jgi:hypothetical protein
VNGTFSPEGAIVSVPIDANGVAEVELATSFNAGDNFRVVATLNAFRLLAMTSNLTVPTTGPVPGFPISVTDQRAVWRRLHIEQDWMAPIPWQGPVSGMITNVAGQGLIRPLPTNMNIPNANQFNGGTLRNRFTAPGGTMLEYAFLIVSHSSGPAPNTIVVFLTDNRVPAAMESITITQGDVQVGQVTQAGAAVNRLVQLTTNLHLSRSNQYQGGIVRIRPPNGQWTNYHAVANTSAAPRPTLTDTVTILANAAPALGEIQIYDDDYSTNAHSNTQSGRITSSGQPAGGQVVVTTNMNIPTANLFAKAFSALALQITQLYLTQSVRMRR